ncbi:MAG: phosphate ABC transporter substrate-binding protein [Clostridiaceae bacterium]|nr:phosphate ABC transporter substrate-binding protein [Clostridiaceae bacterium]
MKSFIRQLMAVALAGSLLFTAACAADQGATIGTTGKTSNTAGSTTGSTAGAVTTAAKLSGKIVASGSTSMEELMQALGEAFSTVNTDVMVEIQGGGSSTGVKNVSEGVSEIGNSSRALKDDEKKLGLTSYVVAYDGIALVVNPANKVTALTSQQVKDIFTGKVTNWKDVGGTDAPIVVILRESGSGTRDGFEELLGIANQCVASQEVNETGIVKSTVAGNANAIGYMSLGKVDQSLTALTIDNVKPSEATVLDKSYKLQRPFLCLTKGNESDLVKAFMTFILSDEGQAMVAKKGFVKVG